MQHAAALVADQPSAIVKWNGEKAAMQSLGYKVLYDQQFGITTTDFTPNVIAPDGVLAGPAGDGRVAALLRRDVADAAAAVLASDGDC